ncbi:MAG: metalloregulator ArsR/SmtB family transcription factor [Methanobacteriaceae archaeon]|jgi:ArsR family transcriptional regulator|nr:MAG: transcriptional regulator [Methanobacterium sp. BRmetb2]MCC7557324.1 metalloregulator ArsR/SmtB family transcription factor [Methanobacteriaceae archaeon]
MKKCGVTSGCVPDPKQIKKLELILKKMPPEDKFEAIASKLKAISDPTRLRILYLLSDGELCVCEIIFALKKPQSTVSHHLNVLKNAGFLKGRKDGLWIHYKLKNPYIVDLIQEIVKIV